MVDGRIRKIGRAVAGQELEKSGYAEYQGKAA